MRRRVRHPQTNESVERLNQVIKDEFNRAAFWKKPYCTLEEIQAELNEFMRYYYQDRTNQGRYSRGRIPLQTFIDG